MNDAEHAPAGSSLSLQNRIDAVCDAFEAAWRSGKPSQIEDALQEVVESERGPLFRELLAVEIELHREAGERPLAVEYRQRFPQFTAFVDEVFAAGTGDTLDVTQPPSTVLGAPHSDEMGITIAPARSSLKETSVGERFGDYELLKEIARGGMGVVYKARQVSLNRTVALKMMLSGQLADAEEIRRFRIEAEAAAQLRHPHIVPIFEVGEIEGRHFLSMDFIEGRSLAQIIAKTPLPNLRAAEYVRDIAGAIQHAHERGILHRDLKPANVLVDVRDQVHVTDFGLAKRTDSDGGPTIDGQILGTPSYMPPEQAAGKQTEVTVRSDVYSLGAVLYEALTGKAPFRGNNPLDTLILVLEREVVAPRTLNPTIPQDLETICLKCLQKPAEKRYGSAAELTEELGRYLRGEPILARPVGRIERAWRWSLRNPRSAALVIAGCLIVLLGGVSWVLRERSISAEIHRAQAEEIARQKDQLAQAQEYFALASQAREESTRREPGWTWRTSAALAKAAGKRSTDFDLQEQRSLAITSANSIDIQLAGVLADGVLVGDLAFSPDGRTLAIAEQKKVPSVSVLLYDTESRTSIRSFSLNVFASNLGRLLTQGTKGKFQNGFTRVAFSTDGRQLAAGTRFGEVLLWDLAQRQPASRTVKICEGAVRSIQFTPDGSSLLATCEGGPPDVVAVDLTAEPLTPGRRYSNAGRDFAVTPDGRWLLASHAEDGNRIRVHELATGNVRPLDVDIAGGRLTISRNGRFAVAVAEGGVSYFSLTGETLGLLGPPRSGGVNQQAGIVAARWGTPVFGGDDAFLATCDSDLAIRLRHVVSGEVLAAVPVTGETPPVCSVSADGVWLAVAAETTTRLFEVRRNRPERVFPVATTNPIEAADLSSDGRRFAWLETVRGAHGLRESSVGAFDIAETRVIWSQKTRCPDRDPHIERQHWFQPHVCFDPSGERLVVNSPLEGLHIEDLRGPTAWPQSVLPDSEPCTLILASEFQLADESAGAISQVDASSGKALVATDPGREFEARVRLPDSLKNQPGSGSVGIFVRVRTEPRGATVPRLRFRWADRKGYDGSDVDSGGYSWWLVTVMDRSELRATSPAVLGVGTAGADFSPKTFAWDAVAVVPFQPHREQGKWAIWPDGPVQFSADGKRIWGISGEDRIIGWNANSGQVEASNDNRWQILGTNRSGVSCVAAGDREVVVGTELGQVLVIDPQDGRLRRMIRGRDHLSGRAEPILAVSLDRHDESVAIGTEQGAVAIHKIADGAEVVSLPRQSTSVLCVALAAEGDSLWTGTRMGTVTMWRREETGWSRRFDLPRFAGPIRSLCLSRDGRRLLVAVAGELAVRIFDLGRIDVILHELDMY